VTSRLNLVFCATLTRVSRDNAPALIATVPDTKTGINQTLTVPNPDFVRSQRKYRDIYVVIVINK
jgi:hypothetical protein